MYFEYRSLVVGGRAFILCGSRPVVVSAVVPPTGVTCPARHLGQSGHLPFWILSSFSASSSFLLLLSSSIFLFFRSVPSRLAAGQEYAEADLLQWLT